MMKPESKRSITIEDLLRLKRAERPPAEFWNEFDRALRAKQLAALVEKRPWWQAMPNLRFGFRRYQLPFGAAAIVALTFFSLRTDRGAQVAVQPALPVTTPSLSEANPPASPVADVRAPVPMAGPRSDNAVSAMLVAATTPADAAAEMSGAEATWPGEISRMLPLIGASGGDTAEELSPSARAIAANLATVRGNEAVLTSTLLNTGNAAEVRATRPVVEPLQQIASPTERRRSSLYTAMASMAYLEGPARNAERAASRLSQDELYDRIHRFGARGNLVNMKF